MPVPMNPLPPQAYLLEAFRYDPDTGIIYGNENRPKEHFANEQAWRRFLKVDGGQPQGIVHKEGYLHINLGCKPYKAARIIWKMMTGEDPAGFIDHKNKNRTDNRWENLRVASAYENARNAKCKCTSSTGEKNICIQKGKYRVKITGWSKSSHVGYYDTMAEAIVARDKALAIIHKEFASSGDGVHYPCDRIRKR